MKPYYRNDKKFMELWDGITEIISYPMFIDHYIKISTAQAFDEITKEQEKLLLMTLTTYSIIRKINEEG